jgi:hypothetical protein
MYFGDDLRNGLANPWYFTQAILRNEVPDGFGKKSHVFGRSQVSSRPVRIPSIEHGPAAKLIEQACYLGGIHFRHVRHLYALTPGHDP